MPGGGDPCLWISGQLSAAEPLRDQGEGSRGYRRLGVGPSTAPRATSMSSTAASSSPIRRITSARMERPRVDTQQLEAAMQRGWDVTDIERCHERC